MKKNLCTIILLALIMTVVLTSFVACNKPDDNGGNGPIVVDSIEEQTRQRAIQLAKSTIDKYIDHEIHSEGEIFMYDTYNPWTKEAEGGASVWHYTAVVAMASRLAAITEGDDNSYFANWCDELWTEMEWYKGSATITSYNSSQKRWMYAVNRANKKGGANIRGQNAVYDDQMWIIKEYVYSYLRTGNETYLTLAEELTETCLDGWDTSINPETGKEFGGITWGPGYQSKHTCSNAPMIAPLVELYYIYTDKGDNAKAKEYLDWAEKIYDFCYATFRNSNDLYGDLIGTTMGFDKETTLKVTLEHGTLDITEYSYNTGTMLQGGALLYKVTGNKTYLEQAQISAEAADRVFGLYDEEKGLNEYCSTSTLWFNLELLLGFINLAEVDDSQYADVSKSFVEDFRKTLDYAYENYYSEGILPRNLLKGWVYGNTFDTNKDVMDSAAAAEMYAMIYQYYANQQD